MKTTSLAFRNLSRQKRRSFLLAAAVAFGFFIVTIVDALAAGSLQNLSEQFSFLVGGNVFIMASQKDGEKVINRTTDEAFIKSIIEKSGIKTIAEGKKIASGGTLIFEGQKVFTNISGCDFEKEVFLKEKLHLVQGNWDAVKAKNALIVGEKMAAELGLDVGDTVLFELQTVKGYATLGEFIIAAINKDVSLLGSINVYGNIEYLNELYELEEGEFYYYTIMAKDHKKQDEIANLLEALIRKTKPVTNRMEAIKKNPKNIMKALNEQMKEAEWEGDYYSVFTFNDEVPNIKQILQIVQYVSLGVLITLFLVIMVGISNTYKMVIYERIKEIGTMRALGVKQKQAGRIFMWESVLLSLFGSIAGFVLAIIVMGVLSLFTFKNEDLSLFLNNGHWSYELNVFSVFLKFIIVALLTMLAVRGSVKKVTKLHPAEALRTTK